MHTVSRRTVLGHLLPSTASLAAKGMQAVSAHTKEIIMTLLIVVRFLIRAYLHIR